MARHYFDDNASPHQRTLDQSGVSVPRSRFDLSHVHTGQAFFGALAPVLCLETLPNQDFDINISANIQLRNPTPRPLINGCRVYFHAYYNRNRDLWEGWQNFCSHGIRLDVNLKKPSLVHNASNDNDRAVEAFTPLSLADYFGIPSSVLETVVYSGNSPLKPLRSFQTASKWLDGSSYAFDWQRLSESPSFVDALPFVAYQRNWRDFYSNKNLLMNSKFWFPDNENHFILPYSWSNGNNLALALWYSDPSLQSISDAYSSFEKVSCNLLGRNSPYGLGIDITPEPNNPSTELISIDGSLDSIARAPNLCGLKFRSFRGDRFTTGSPFVDLIRGNIPSLEEYVNSKYIQIGKDNDRYPIVPTSTTPSGTLNGGIFNVADKLFTLIHNGAWSNTGVGLYMPNITMNDIRALETMTVMRERLARTNGEYNEWIYSLFGTGVSKNNHEGTYIGGFYQDIVFSDITQLSASTEESPLGTKAGQGYSSGSGRIGHFHSDDYGWLQIYMSIVPETYYTQGIQRQFTRETPDEIYNPLWNNLEPQAILNEELYISGTKATDKDVFSYEQRGNEFRSRMNRVSGFSALAHDVASFDSAIVMARRFATTPQLSSKWLSLVPENVDMDVFSFNDEPPFDFSVGFDIDTVAPLPRVSVPGSLSSNLHA